jgi:hypothetical protein
MTTARTMRTGISRSSEHDMTLDIGSVSDSGGARA